MNGARRSKTASYDQLAALQVTQPCLLLSIYSYTIVSLVVFFFLFKYIYIIILICLYLFTCGGAEYQVAVSTLLCPSTRDSPSWLHSHEGVLDVTF